MISLIYILSKWQNSDSDPELKKKNISTYMFVYLVCSYLVYLDSKESSMPLVYF